MPGIPWVVLQVLGTVGALTITYTILWLPV